MSTHFAAMPRHAHIGPRFVSENELEALYGISRRTWQKRRLLGQEPKFYKVGAAVRYDLAEVENFIRSGGVDPGAR